MVAQGYLQGARALGGEPIQHEQAVQGELGMRKAENRVIEKSRNQQHDQGLGALRSSRITHMTPKMHQGLARQVNAPIKRTGFGEADNVESDDEEEVHERSPQYTSKDSSVWQRSMRGSARGQNLSESRQGDTSAGARGYAKILAVILRYRVEESQQGTRDESA